MSKHKRPSQDESAVQSEKGSDGMMSVACIVENRAREVVVAIARSYRCVEVFT